MPPSRIRPCREKSPLAMTVPDAQVAAAVLEERAGGRGGRAGEGGGEAAVANVDRATAQAVGLGDREAAAEDGGAAAVGVGGGERDGAAEVLDELHRRRAVVDDVGVHR